MSSHIRSILASLGSVFLAYGVPLIEFVRVAPYTEWRVKRDTPTPFCDLYQPDEPTNTLFVFIHGGGWHSGTKDDTHWVGHAFVGRVMASRGVTTAVLTYPCARISLGGRAVFFAALAVVAVALAFVLSWILFPLRFWLSLALVCYIGVGAQVYLREFATNGDHACTAQDQYNAVADTLVRLRILYPTHRIVLSGHSAGGHLAMLYATDASHAVDIDTVIGISGVYDMVDVAHIAPPLGWFVHAYCIRPAFRGLSLETFSPIRAIDKTHARRVVLVNAAYDNPTLISQADAFHDTLHPRVEKHRVKDIGCGHGYGLLWSAQLWDAVMQECAAK